MIRKPALKHIILLRNPDEREPVVVGGVEKLMLEWCERIDYSQARVTLAVSTHWVNFFKDKVRQKNLPMDVVALPFMPGKDRSIKKFFKLFPYLMGSRADTIVFFQGWIFSFGLAEVLAGFLAAPGRVFIHDNQGPSKPYPKQSKKHFGFIRGAGLWWHLHIYETMLRAHLAQKVIVVSNEIRELLIKWWKYPPAKILIRYHGVDLSRYRPCLKTRHGLRKDLGIGLNETVIITAARLSREKCIDRLIRGFDAVSGQFQGLRLMILGKGPLKKDLEKLAGSLPSGPKVMFLGHVDNVQDYLKTSDIYALASDKEGFSISLMEAMACGLICVATRCTGTDEIIREGINGFLTEKSHMGLSESLRKALQMTEDQKIRMRDTGMQLISENFEINNRIKDVFGVLGIGYRAKVPPNS